jgi:hypothetical protein
MNRRGNRESTGIDCHCFIQVCRSASSAILTKKYIRRVGIRRLDIRRVDIPRADIRRVDIRRIDIRRVAIRRAATEPETAKLEC